MVTPSRRVRGAARADDRRHVVGVHGDPRRRRVLRVRAGVRPAPHERAGVDVRGRDRRLRRRHVRRQRGRAAAAATLRRGPPHGRRRSPPWPSCWRSAPSGRHVRSCCSCRWCSAASRPSPARASTRWSRRTPRWRLARRSFARFETRFQLGWVAGAVAATAIAIPIRYSLVVLAVFLLPAAALYMNALREGHAAHVEDPFDPVEVARRRIDHAVEWHRRDLDRLAVTELAGVVDLARATGLELSTDDDRPARRPARGRHVDVAPRHPRGRVGDGPRQRRSSDRLADGTGAEPPPTTVGRAEPSPSPTSPTPRGGSGLLGASDRLRRHRPLRRLLADRQHDLGRVDLRAVDLDVHGDGVDVGWHARRRRPARRCRGPGRRPGPRARASARLSAKRISASSSSSAWRRRPARRPRSSPRRPRRRRRPAAASAVVAWRLVGQDLADRRHVHLGVARRLLLLRTRRSPPPAEGHEDDSPHGPRPHGGQASRAPAQPPAGCCRRSRSADDLLDRPVRPPVGQVGRAVGQPGRPSGAAR